MTGDALNGARLSKVQYEMLDIVCRTNGGGVRIRCRINDEGQVEPVSTAYRKLHSLGLIQGKAGGYETVVHTREGLKVWRDWTRPLVKSQEPKPND